MSTGRKVDFWFDFASTYSYLAAARIFPLGPEEAADFRWRPMLFGAILREQGYTTSPFNTQPAKGRHMWRDVERRAAGLGIRVRRPETFPQGSLQAARVMLVGLEEGWANGFAMAVFASEFQHGLDIESPEVIAACVDLAGGNGAAAMSRGASAAIKERLRIETATATAAGVFGAPTFVVDGELFWGDDRLDEAMAWRRGDHPLQIARQGR